ncbi:hypothetical protein [Bacillus pumilus]|uniref:hypothetical protein n=1 Tax=Bacillus pumilus TaxID=1408 RepID=UPI0016438CDD|nr:hypothetical protein [Bacillus pumilus]
MCIRDRAYVDHPFQVVTMDWYEDETPYIQELTKGKRIGTDIQICLLYTSDAADDDYTV